MRTRPAFARLMTGVLALGLIGGGLTAVAAPAAAADPVLTTPAPPQDRDAEAATADSQPTVQIDKGVVWDQTIVGNTVFAGGDFKQTRPAGTSPGDKQLTPRTNLLSYDVRTGDLLPFAPVLNGIVRGVEASPDGATLYVGGAFTTVDGKPRNGIAAFDVATGALLDSFQPAVGGQVYGIVATEQTVYIGGKFTQVAGVSRTNLAAVTTTGALTAWAPVTDGLVEDMVMAPSQDRVIVAGRFSTVNRVTNRGTASLNRETGVTMPWALNSIIINSGSAAGTQGLSADATQVYGASWSYGGTASIEGTWAADPMTGAMIWAQNGEGDHYDVYASGNTAYGVGHSHMASQFGGWPDMNTPAGNYQNSVALTTAPKGTSTSAGYWNHSTWKVPALVQWYPKWITGTYTGMGQAGWSIEGNAEYVVVGGEFQGVNGKPQYGLARFPRGTTATSTIGPRMTPTASAAVDRWESPTFAANPGGGRVSIRPNFDRDDRTLTYELYRAGTAEPVARTTFASDWWLRTSQTVVLTDTSAEPNTRYTYTVRAVDKDGNSATSAAVAGTTSTATVPDYVRAVLADSASLFWRLGGSSPAQDWAGAMDGSVSGFSSAATGVVKGDSGAWATGSAVSASTAVAATRSTVGAGDAGSIELWVRTQSTTGGQLASLSSSASGNSAAVYRTLFMRADGAITFGVSPNGQRQTATTRMSYNDGAWHHVVATVGEKGMLIYVDGALVGSNLSVTAAGNQQGYWRVGTDSLAGWSGRPTTDYLTGELDEFAVYPAALSRGRVTAHYTAARGEQGGGEDGGGQGGDGGQTPQQPDVVIPADAYGSYLYATNPDAYWRLGDPVGTTGSVADSGPNGSAGKIYTAPKFGQEGVVAGDGSASFKDTGAITEQRARANPTTFTETAWFRTTSTRGGRIMGFGSNANGWAGSYDRHVYMRNNGQLDFGVYAGGQKIVTSPAAYNDGQWHQVTASMGSDGMKLYVDGQLVGANAAVTTATSYTAYWKVGADYTWNSSSYYLDGLIDEAALYSRVLTPTEVANSYAVGTGAVPPTTTMALTVDGLDVRGDAAGTVAGAGASIASYDWDFGDGSTATGATASHAYAAPGTYRVTLRATDTAGLSTVAIRFARVDYYAQAVRSSAPDFYWRFDEPAGTTGSVVDSSGNGATSTIYSSPKFGQDGALAGNGAVSFVDVGTVIDQRARTNPNTFTESVWIKTSSTRGGQIMGFGTNAAGYSGSYDRLLYMRANGKIDFGVGATKTITSPLAYNDGQWHMVTSTLGSDGMKLYVDGALVASNATVTAGQSFTGYWKVGRDYTWNGSAYYFDGLVDEAAVYSRVLSPEEIATLRAVYDGAVPPTATMSLSAQGYRVDVDAAGSRAHQGRSIASYAWDFGDGTTATGATASHTYARPGTYTVTLRVTDSDGRTTVTSKTADLDLYVAAVRDSKPDFYWRLDEPAGTTGSVADSSGNNAANRIVYAPAFGQPGAIAGNGSAQFTANGLVIDQRAVTNPNTFTESAWFRTTTTRGGRIIGLGTNAAGYSGSYDRMVSLRNNGQVEFGVNSGGVKTVLSPASYNDGQWHMVTASMGSDGMKLYVDGALVGSNAAVTAGQNYTGYWKVGRDYTWNSSDHYISGEIDEAAVYSRVLSAAEVTNIYRVANGAILPTASFDSAVTDALATFDASASTAFQGKAIASYAWDFGDGTTGTGATPSHTYAEVGDFRVTLRVTDSDGLVGSVTRLVSVPLPSRDPVAVARAVPGGLEVQLDGSASSPDDDHSIASYAWDFGDGTTGTGARVLHRYAEAGTYTVTLTVTDDSGRSAATTLTATADATVAADAFERTGSLWGTADQGGAWSTDKGLPVGDGTGQVVLPAAGQTRNAWLKGVAARDVDVRMDFSLDKGSAGGGTFVSTSARRTDDGEYRTKLVFNADRTISVFLTKLVGGVETTLKSAVLPDAVYTAGDAYSLRFQAVTGPDGATTLQARVWKADQAEPTTWFVKATDADPAVAGAGYVGIVGYLSAMSTAAPQTVRISDYRVSTPTDAPTAAFESAVDGQRVSFDATGSSALPGRTLRSYAWDFGDGATATGATPSHTYRDGGDFPVTLRVTDSAGLTATVTRTVTVAAPPREPVAAATVVPGGLEVRLDGSGSTPGAGAALTSYAWDFGDGQSAEGATVSHRYAEAGTYTVTLTVTNDAGLHATTTLDVVADPTIAADAFERTGTAWGTAETGGAWTTDKGMPVGDGVGQVVLPAAGQTRNAWLTGVAARDVDVRMDFSLEKASAGGGTFVSASARRTDAGEYRAKLVLNADRTISVFLTRIVGGTETTLKAGVLPQATYAAGDVYSLRFQAVTAEDGSTSLQARVWKADQAEPSTWFVTATDADPAVAGPGGVGIVGYLSGASTVAPQTVRIHDYRVTAP